MFLEPHTHTTPPLGVELPPFIDAFDNLLRAIETYWPEVYVKEKPLQYVKERRRGKEGSERRGNRRGRVTYYNLCLLILFVLEWRI